MIKDGLTEAFSNVHMGITAENIAERWHISREDQDRFAVTSQQRCEAAQKAGRFKDEIVPVEIPQKRGEPKIFDTDEFPRPGTTLEALAKLRPAFKKDGTVTAGNSSGINDGAGFLILMSGEKAKELGIKPMARVMTVEDLDLVEANEAFASQSIAVIRDLKLNPEKVNVNGGAIALGHPIGASGVRILISLIYEMHRRHAKNGLATLCIGGGQGAAIIIENMM